jgi:subfamily B ATP-binding cassette protein MsbA
MLDSSQRKTYLRLLRYLLPYKMHFAAALLAMVVYGATDGAVPYLLKRILDDVFGAQNTSMLYFLVGIILFFAVIRGAFGFLQRYLAAYVGLRIVRDIRNELQRKFLYLSPDFYLTTSTGSLISRVTNDTLLMRSALTDAAASLLRDTVRIIALITAALYLDPFLAGIALLAFPIGFLPILKFGKRIRKLSRVGQDQLGGLTSLLQEVLVGHRVVQAFGQEEHEYQKFRAENDRFTDTVLKAEKYGALSGPTNELVASAATAAVILYGGLSVISGVRTQGDFIAFITSLFLLYEPLKKLSRINIILQSGISAAERIFEVLDTEPLVSSPPVPKQFEGVGEGVRFEAVSFRYPERAFTGEDLRVGSLTTTENGEQSLEYAAHPLALQEISFEVRPGTTVALVGRSGSGKSTLTLLLNRFFDPSAGRVCIAGTDIREFSLEDLRDSIAIVQQNTFLFNDSLFNNIAYGRNDATEEEVIAAAKDANAHRFISALPHGYQTVVGEFGASLSGGERARISIARALLKNSPILVLDEATANLDSESEGLVQEAIERVMKGRTVLVIAHRLSTIRSADAIAVLRDGRLVEFGNHQALLAERGEYARLYQLQFREEELKQSVNGS